MTLDPVQVLRKEGLKATTPRVRLLEALGREILPRSAVFIASKLKKTMDAVTVYRSLEALAERGIVRRTDFRHGHAEYELAEGRVHHHHLVCESCGTVEDVGICGAQSLEKRVLSKSKRFLEINSHALEFFGRCAACA